VDVLSENKTLIAYATRGGTTEDYAKAISDVLTDEFIMQADLINLRKSRNPDLTQYQNIIAGAGIRMFRMHREGANFLEKKNFGEKNVGIFLSSLEPRDEAIKKYVDVILQKNITLKPIAVEVFGGRMRMFGKTSQDQTDIEKAKDWTRKISGHIQS
jgi:menaquinone-dependent protoporphyrinogen IX oxidase